MTAINSVFVIVVLYFDLIRFNFMCMYSVFVVYVYLSLCWCQWVVFFIFYFILLVVLFWNWTINIKFFFFFRFVFMCLSITHNSKKKQQNSEICFPFIISYIFKYIHSLKKWKNPNNVWNECTCIHRFYSRRPNKKTPEIQNMQLFRYTQHTLIFRLYPRIYKILFVFFFSLSITHKSMLSLLFFFYFFLKFIFFDVVVVVAFFYFTWL